MIHLEHLNTDKEEDRLNDVENHFTMTTNNSNENHSNNKNEAKDDDTTIIHTIKTYLVSASGWSPPVRSKFQDFIFKLKNGPMNLALALSFCKAFFFFSVFLIEIIDWIVDLVIGFQTGLSTYQGINLDDDMIKSCRKREGNWLKSINFNKVECDEEWVFDASTSGYWLYTSNTTNCICISSKEGCLLDLVINSGNSSLVRGFQFHDDISYDNKGSVTRKYGILLTVMTLLGRILAGQFGVMANRRLKNGEDEHSLNVRYFFMELAIFMLEDGASVMVNWLNLTNGDVLFKMSAYATFISGIGFIFYMCYFLLDTFRLGFKAGGCKVNNYGLVYSTLLAMVGPIYICVLSAIRILTYFGPTNSIGYVCAWDSQVLTNDTIFFGIGSALTCSISIYMIFFHKEFGTSF